MMDIVEELNLMVPQMPMVGERRDAYAPWRAADEITRLRAVVKKAYHMALEIEAGDLSGYELADELHAALHHPRQDDQNSDGGT